jgi:hypothetical protein
MAFQINTNTVVDNNRKAFFLIGNFGTFTSTTRPASPSAGDVIFNSTTARLEYWNGSSWISAI